MSQPSSSAKVTFNKPWLSTSQQVQKLANRGLVVIDRQSAEEFLSHVNYYRFSGYCLAFETNRHTFNSGVTFDDVKGSYLFDLSLRDLVTEALEIIEVDFRTSLSYNFSRIHGALGHVNPGNFFSRFKHTDWLKKVRDRAHDSRNEIFVDHFNRKYHGFPDLPAWMLMEVVTFGDLSRMFSGMDKKDQNACSKKYNVNAAKSFESIVHHFVYVRNVCAHHSRLWDKAWKIRPTLPHGPLWKLPHLPSNGEVYATILLLYHFLRHCSATREMRRDWKNRLFNLLDSPPNLPNALSVMGMPNNWRSHPAWRL